MSNNRIYGFHSIENLFNTNPNSITKVYVTNERKDKRASEFLNKLLDTGITVLQTHKTELEKLAGSKLHQGIVADIAQQINYNETYLENLIVEKENLLFLVLDEITDAHNLGACMRTAEAAKVDAIIVPKDRSASITAITHKTSSGAASIVPFIRVTNLARTLKFLQDNYVFIIGTAGESSVNIFEQDYSKLNSIALVMGNEGKGLRRLTRENCDQLIYIPMLGKISSLNVSVATGICLFEINRQLNKLK